MNVCQNISSRALFFLSFILLAWSNFTYAQNQVIQTLPYDPAYLKQEIRRNAVNANSRDSFELIPKSVVYETIFKKFQREIDLISNQITSEDRQTILNLPSHSDAQFAHPIRLSQSNLCTEFASQRGNGNSQIIQLSRAYDSIQKFETNMLENHYERVLASLSESAIALIEHEILTLEGTDKLGYSTMDLPGLAETVPEFARQILDFGCVNLANSQPVDQSIVSLMIDEPYFKKMIRDP